MRSAVGRPSLTRSATTKRTPSRPCFIWFTWTAAGTISAPIYSLILRSTDAIQKQSPQGTSSIESHPSAAIAAGSARRTAAVCARSEPVPERDDSPPQLLRRCIDSNTLLRRLETTLTYDLAHDTARYG